MLIHIFHHKTAFDLCDYTSKPVQYCNSILLLTIIGFHIFLLDRLQCVTSFITCFKIQSILNLPKVKLNGLKETIEFLVVMRDCRKLNIICCSCPGSFGIAPSGEWLGVCIHAYTPFSSCPRNRTEGQIFTNIDNLTPLHERSCWDGSLNFNQVGCLYVEQRSGYGPIDMVQNPYKSLYLLESIPQNHINSLRHFAILWHL